jgi:hypothetical protein
LVLFATSAGAVYYTFTGKYISNRGTLTNIPMVGNTPCATVTIMSGPGLPAAMSMVPAPTTPAMRTMTVGAGPYGCVKAAGVLNATKAGVGGAFVIPPKVLTKPLGGYVPAVQVTKGGPVKQLATSFKITGPAAAFTTPPAGTMGNGMNTAAFHNFKVGAWMTQTGRAGSMFTWCFGNAACTKIVQAVPPTRPIIVKYAGGGSAFGGTMAYLITTGPNVSSLAVAAGGGKLGFAILAGMGSQPTGRGYADYLTDMLMSGPLWNMYMIGTVTRPIVGMQMLVTSVMTFFGNLFPAAVNYNYGFPLTTRTVLARNTGTGLGNPVITTLSAKGGDVATGMGGRNLSLVAGALAATSLGTQTPNIAEFKLFMPEPGKTLQMLAGVAGLLGIAAWRMRKSR